jgi:hypothetical protein
MAEKRSPRTRIEAYSRHCESLLRDIKDVLSDQEDAKKWEIRYAVDFSEIRSYLQPQESHESAPMPDSWASDPFRQFSVLAEFFKNKRIILTEPHAFELQDFYNNEITRTAGDFADVFLDAVEGMQRLRTSRKFKRMQTLATHAQRGQLSTKETEEAIEFFTVNAPVLVAIAEGADLSAMKRLRRLMEEDHFIDLDEIAPDDHGFQEVEVARLFDEIKRRRLERAQPFRSEATDNDARAIELLRAANWSLISKRQRILLVSRSSSMSEAIDVRRKTSPLWHDVPRFVRHPRVFSAAYRPPEGSGVEDFLRDLRFRKELLELFVENARNTLETDELTPEKMGELEKLLGKIQDTQEDFLGGENLANALRGRDLLPAAGANQQLAHVLLSYLRGHLFESARRQIRKILDEATRTLGVLGGKMEVLDSEFGSVLYPIMLTNRELTAHIAKHALKWTITVREAASLFEKAATPGVSNEEFLFMIGISLGAVNKWKVAKRSVVHAIALAEQARKPLAEARFFHAHCLRKLFRRSRGKHEDHLRHLRHAIAEIDAAAEECQAFDARHLNEKGILLANLLGEGEGRREDVEATFQQALAAEHTPKLDVQIRNNLAFLFSEEPDNQVKAVEYLDDLERVLFKNYDLDGWPGFAADTLIYGRYKVQKDSAEIAQLARWRDAIKPILDKNDLTSGDREQIRGHMEEIDQTIQECGGV